MLILLINDAHTPVCVCVCVCACVCLCLSVCVCVLRVDNRLIIFIAYIVLGVYEYDPFILLHCFYFLFIHVSKIVCAISLT